MADMAVQIVGYDPHWPDLFAEQRNCLQEILDPWLAGPIEHVGSTAVPRLAAKPIVDILAPVVSLVRARSAVEHLAAPAGCIGLRTRIARGGCGSCGHASTREHTTST